jgi:hypothetical protein
MSGFTSEERRVPRKRVRTTAAAVLDGRHLFNCRTVDLTEAGARLCIDPARAPDRFQLIEIALGMVYSARVVWRGDGEVGVAFLRARPVEAPDTPEWIAGLWRTLKTGARAADAA